LKHTSMGRIAALAGITVLAVAACSSPAATSAPTTAPSTAPSTAPASAPASEPASAPASAPASQAAGGGITVGYLPKDIVNQYFAAAKTGVDKAAAETGGTVTQVGPNEAKADLQIPFITDLTTQGVDAIIISADGKDEVAPALKAAKDAGIKVVGFDSAPAVGAYDVFVNQADFSGVGTSLVDWTCEIVPDCSGDFAILSAAATATNQNTWIDGMKQTLASDPKYAKLKLVDTVYGDDDATKSTQQAQALLTKYPNLKAIVAPTTVGILAAAQVVSQAGKSDAVKVTGLGFPNDMKPFVHDGTTPVFGLWSVPDLGYLSYVIADKLVKGEITGKEGETFTVPGLNNDQPYTIGKDSVVTLGPAFRFDTTNVDQFNF
jgi:rhamnose transport system substrate-binding protein